MGLAALLARRWDPDGLPQKSEGLPSLAGRAGSPRGPRSLDVAPEGRERGTRGVPPASLSLAEVMSSPASSLARPAGSAV
jgi:hypothetical protein